MLGVFTIQAEAVSPIAVVPEAEWNPFLFVSAALRENSFFLMNLSIQSWPTLFWISGGGIQAIPEEDEKKFQICVHQETFKYVFQQRSFPTSLNGFCDILSESQVEISPDFCYSYSAI